MASSSSSSSSPQPLPTLSGAWRAAREALSFSSTRARRDTGVHHHHIDRYSTLDAMSVPGQCVESAPFNSGGHEWQLRYYPNGVGGTHRDRVTVFLVLTGGPWWRFFYHPSDVTAAYKVSILDAEGNVMVAEARDSVVPQRFASRWSSPGAKDVVTTEQLRAAMKGRKEDGIIVRCDVDVMNLEKESRIKWYLRQLLK